MQSLSAEPSVASPELMLRSSPTMDGGSTIEVWRSRSRSLPDATGGAELEDPITEDLSAEPMLLRKMIGTYLKDIGLDPEGQYLPDDAYSAIFSKRRILQALGGQIIDLPLVEYIQEHACKTFASLLFVFGACDTRRQAMTALKLHAFTDELLASHEQEICACQAPCTHAFSAGAFPSGPWTTDLFGLFKQMRWQFLVLAFESSHFLYELDKNQLLPFTGKVSNGAVRGGYFSEVTCVEMLSEQQDRIQTMSKKLVVALKSLRHISDKEYSIDKEWRREAKAHQQLNDRSEHIIQALAAFKQIGKNPQNSKYHLLLEWADGGSLYDFWQAHQGPQIRHDDIQGSRDRVLRILHQLHGIADAIEGMHSTSAGTPGGSVNGSIPSSPETPPLSTGPSINIEEADGFGLGPSLSPPLTSSLDESRLDPTNPFLGRRTTGFSTKNWRHGDIKPENILRFTDPDSTYLGTLKLADLGRARQHELVTKMRQTKETELWRTRWYEPPDLEEINHKQAEEKISRLFDIWSMGCVIFETVLWVLYGYESHNLFVKANNLAPGEPGQTPYWRKVVKGKFVTYEISPVVTKWISDILEHDPEGKGALGELLVLVRDRLLKTKLPPITEVYTLGCRTNAQDLREQISDIIDRATQDNNEAFLFTGNDRNGVKCPDSAANGQPSDQNTQGSLHLPSQTSSNGVHPTLIAQQRVYTTHMEDKWKAERDTAFAEPLLRDRNFNDEPELCDHCSTIDFTALQVNFSSSTISANAQADECDLCTLLDGSLKRIVIPFGDELRCVNFFDRGQEEITLVRDGHYHMIRLDDKKVKLLRLCYSDPDKRIDKTIPIGAPSLVPLGDDIDSFARLPNAWIRECDKIHHDTCDPSPSRPRILPKRLINVKKPRSPYIIDTADPETDPEFDAKTAKYIALSHRWGAMPENAVTTPENLKSRMGTEGRIPKGEIPLTFQNAIKMTKALGCHYLWIDSLCIMQGPTGDFVEQADKMQTTFSGAYCVLAACSSKGATEGFLSPRKSPFVKLDDLYVSSITDDFDRDVLRSILNSRGWVLQERALARRTIFFTSTQMYWECGDSIRCETLAKMKNETVAFLGDANFPDYTISGQTRTVGDQLALFIDLVQRYTKLEFSHPQDRPVAIDGLMNRLTEAFKTLSLAGIFESFWGRCLLWRRADGVPELTKIVTGSHTLRMPPSWSWMAYEGAVSYITPKGGSVEWDSPGIIIPFEHGTQASWLRTSARRSCIEIRAAKAFAFALSTTAPATEGQLFYDRESFLPGAETKCVVIGREKVSDGTPAEARLHYVLIVEQTTTNGPFERVGVGYLLGKHIQLQSFVPHISIE